MHLSLVIERLAMLQASRDLLKRCDQRLKQTRADAGLKP